MSLGRHTAVTDTGRKRRHNEDSFVVAPPLFAVADGMGGANAGEIASRLAVAAVRETPGDESAGERFVVSLVQEANRRVYQRQADDAEASGMGTTMTVALIEDGVVRFGHVGDSRAYLYRDGELRQLTEDHSLVGELVRSGRISAEEANTHPQRSVITRALGTEPDVDVDTFTVDAQPGDVFLLCSDGLYSMVETEQLLDLLRRHHDDLEAAARAMIGAANRGGGEDNITVVAFEIARSDEDTVAMPAVGDDGGERSPDEEDTLDETDAVPAVTTQVLRPDELEAVRDEEPPTAAPSRDDEPERGRKGLRAAVLLLVAVAILAAVLVVLYLLDVL